MEDPQARAPRLSWKARSALLALLALGAGLRLWGIDYGLPNSLCRPDEEKIVGSADSVLRRGDWPPRTVIYPSLLIHADLAVLWATSEVGQLLGTFRDRDDFLSRWPLLQYRIGRLVSACFGVATILATFALGRRLSGSQAVGFLSALALATLYLHVRDSHFATVDVAAGFFTTLALVFALRAGADDSPRPWLLAGAAAGLAAATKYNAIAAFLPLLAAATFRLRDGSALPVVAARVAGAALAAAAGFGVASPSILIRWSDAVSEVRATQRLLYASHDQLGLFVHLEETFPVGFGEPLCLSALVGLVRGSKRRPILLLLAFLLPSFASFATARLVFPRYLVTLAPPLVAIAAEALLAFIGSSRIALLASGLLLAAPGLVRSAAFDRVAARQDTRLMVADWVNQRYLPGTRFLVCHGYGRPELDLRSRTVDCRKPELPFEWAHAVITPSHPYLGRHIPVASELIDWLKKNARRVEVFDPFRAGAAAQPYFYVGDAFYLPFSGLSAVERGGPILTVWELRDAPLRPQRR